MLQINQFKKLFLNSSKYFAIKSVDMGIFTFSKLNYRNAATNEKFWNELWRIFWSSKKAKKYTATTSKHQQQQGAFCTAVWRTTWKCLRNLLYFKRCCCCTFLFKAIHNAKNCTHSISLSLTHFTLFFIINHFLTSFFSFLIYYFISHIYFDLHEIERMNAVPCTWIKHE